MPSSRFAARKIKRGDPILVDHRGIFVVEGGDLFECFGPKSGNLKSLFKVCVKRRNVTEHSQHDLCNQYIGHAGVCSAEGTPHLEQPLDVQLGVTVRINFPERLISDCDQFNCRNKMPGASFEQVRGAAKHAPTCEVKTEL